VKEKEASLIETRNMMSRGGGMASGGLEGTDGVGLDGTSDVMADLDDSSRVGSMEQGSGFGVGKASDGARPMTMDNSMRQNDEADLLDDTSFGIASPAKHATFGEFNDDSQDHRHWTGTMRTTCSNDSMARR